MKKGPSTLTSWLRCLGYVRLSLLLLVCVVCLSNAVEVDDVHDNPLKKGDGDDDGKGEKAAKKSVHLGGFPEDKLSVNSNGDVQDGGGDGDGGTADHRRGDVKQQHKAFVNSNSGNGGGNNNKFKSSVKKGSAPASSGGGANQDSSRPGIGFVKSVQGESGREGQGKKGPMAMEEGEEEDVLNLKKNHSQGHHGGGGIHRPFVKKLSLPPKSYCVDAVVLSDSSTGGSYFVDDVEGYCSKICKSGKLNFNCVSVDVLGNLRKSSSSTECDSVYMKTDLIGVRSMHALHFPNGVSPGWVNSRGRHGCVVFCVTDLVVDVEVVHDYYENEGGEGAAFAGGRDDGVGNFTVGHEDGKGSGGKKDDASKGKGKTLHRKRTIKSRKFPAGSVIYFGDSVGSGHRFRSGGNGHVYAIVVEMKESDVFGSAIPGSADVYDGARGGSAGKENEGRGKVDLFTGRTLSALRSVLVKNKSKIIGVLSGCIFTTLAGYVMLTEVPVKYTILSLVVTSTFVGAKLGVKVCEEIDRIEIDRLNKKIIKDDDRAVQHGASSERFNNITPVHDMPEYGLFEDDEQEDGEKEAVDEEKIIQDKMDYDAAAVGGAM